MLVPELAIFLVIGRPPLGPSDQIFSLGNPWSEYALIHDLHALISLFLPAGHDDHPFPDDSILISEHIQLDLVMFLQILDLISEALDLDSLQALLVLFLLLYIFIDNVKLILEALVLVSQLLYVLVFVSQLFLKLR